MKLYTVFALLLLTAEGTANAQSGRSYKLNWDVPGEELIYRSCGCADACWVAEVRSVRKMGSKAALRCDCEKLYFSEDNGLEITISDDCKEFSQVGKMDLISKRIKALRSPTYP